MKTAKKITAAVLALCTLALILASCGAKPPEEEATTGTEIHSMLDPLGIGETKETGKDKEKNSTAKNDETGSVADTENAEPGETAESESVVKKRSASPIPDPRITAITARPSCISSSVPRETNRYRYSDFRSGSRPIRFITGRTARASRLPPA